VPGSGDPLSLVAPTDEDIQAEWQRVSGLPRSWKTRCRAAGAHFVVPSPRSFPGKGRGISDRKYEAIRLQSLSSASTHVRVCV